MSNSLKSGLDAESQFVLGESREEFAQLQSDYYRRFAPATPEARFQVDNLIRNEWLLRRYHRVEAQVWEYQASLCDQSTGVQLGEAFTKASGFVPRFQYHKRSFSVACVACVACSPSPARK